MKPRRLTGRRFVLNKDRVPEDTGLAPELQVKLMKPDPINKDIIENTPLEDYQVTTVEPGTDIVKGDISYLKLLENYSAVVPDYVLTYHIIKVEPILIGEPIYDTLITVNKPYSNSAMIFSLFNFMMTTGKYKTAPFFRTHCPNNLQESTYARIERIKNPSYSEEHALLVPGLYNSNIQQTEVVSCYYSDHFPLGIKNPKFVSYAFGLDRNKYKNAYDDYGWKTQDIELLNEQPYIYRKLSKLILQFLNVFVFDETIGYHLENVIQGITRNMSSDEFIKFITNTDREKRNAVICFIDRFLKLSNVYDGMPEGYPFNRINSNSIKIMKYNNEISYNDLVEKYQNQGRYILKLYFMKSKDVLLLTYKLLSDEQSMEVYKNDVMSSDELNVFMSTKF